MRIKKKKASFKEIFKAQFIRLPTWKLLKNAELLFSDEEGAGCCSRVGRQGAWAGGGSRSWGSWDPRPEGTPLPCWCRHPSLPSLQGGPSGPGQGSSAASSPRCGQADSTYPGSQHPGLISALREHGSCSSRKAIGGSLDPGPRFHSRPLGSSGA